MAHPLLATHLQQLDRHGYRFWQDMQRVGAFGAFKALTGGAAVSTDRVAIRSDADAARLSFFLADGPPDGLQHPQAVQTLRTFERGRLSLWLASRPLDGQTAYRLLFQEGSHDRIWVGGRSGPAVPLGKAELSDLDGCLNTVKATLTRVEALTQAGWYPSDAVEAVQKVDAARWEGESSDDAWTAFDNMRAQLPGTRPADAVELFGWLRGQAQAHCKEAGKYRIFWLNRMVDEMAYVVSHWSALHYRYHKPPPERVRLNTEARSRVQAYLDIHALKGGRTVESLHAVLQSRGPREPLAEAMQRFTTAESAAQRLDEPQKDSPKLHKFLAGLDSSLSGPWTPAEKQTMFLDHLATFRSVDHALQYWRELVPTAAAPADLPERLAAFRRTTVAEKFHDYGLVAYRTVAELKRPGETWADAAEAYAIMRAGIHGHTERDCQTGTAAFRWLRAMQNPPQEAVAGRIIGVLGRLDETAQVIQSLPDLSDQKRFVELHQAGDKPSVTTFRDAARRARRASRRYIHRLGRKSGRLSNAARPSQADALGGCSGVVCICASSIGWGAKRVSRSPDCNGFENARTAWDALTPGNVEQRKAMKALLYASAGEAAPVLPAFRAVMQHRRADETVDAAADAYLQVRARFIPKDGLKPSVQGEQAAASSFLFMRSWLTADQESRLMAALGTSDGRWVEATCKVLQQLGTRESLQQRIELLGSGLEQVVPAMEQVVRSLPADVDADRAGLALIGAARRDPKAVPAIIAHMHRVPGDRTQAVEWLCSLMAEARSVADFEMGWKSGLYSRLTACRRTPPQWNRTTITC